MKKKQKMILGICAAIGVTGLAAGIFFSQQKKKKKKASMKERQKR